MALLDYLFPPQQSQVAGLLGMDEERMRQQAQRAGLLSTGLGMIAASGPSRMPQGVLQPVAAGLMAGQQAYQGAIDQQLADAMARRKALEPKTISAKEGETIYQIDPRTNQPVQFIQGAPSLPSGYKNALALAGLPTNIKPEDLTPEQFARLNAAQAKITPQTTINVSTEKKYGEALASGLAPKDIAKYEIATQAPAALDQIDRSKQILQSGQVFTGALANQKLELAKFGQAIGATGKNTDEVVANTQMLMAGRAQATLDAIKGSGLGSGQGFTDKDRQFLENARLGNITYSKQALERQLDLEERVARASVQSWNSRFDSLPKSATEPVGLGKVTLPEPQKRQPKGQVKFLGFE
jgi:hypothetical protein